MTNETLSGAFDYTQKEEHNSNLRIIVDRIPTLNGRHIFEYFNVKCAMISQFFTQYFHLSMQFV